MSAGTKKQRRLAPFLTIGVLVALAAFLLWRANGFYTTPMDLRLDHPQFRDLKPAGPIGHGYGIVGTGLILANLLYLLRRRLAKFSLGKLKTWLDLHVVAGLCGALLVAFHSTFQLRTPIATTTAVSLAILVGTGVVGLYIHRLIPKSKGLALQQRVSEVEKVFPEFAQAVRDATARLPCTRLPPSATFLRTLLTVPRWTIEARARRAAVIDAANVDGKLLLLVRVERERVQDLVLELGDLAASEVYSNATTALMRSWRSLHGFMAILMVLTVTVHVAVAWFYGYRWLFSK